MIDLLLITLATACVVNAVHSATIFEGLRQGLLKRAFSPTAWRLTRWAVNGIKCSYCFTFWVALPMTLLIAPFRWSSLVVYFAAVWLTHHAMAAYTLLTEQITAKRQHIQLQQAQLQHLMHASQPQRHDTSAAA